MKKLTRIMWNVYHTAKGLSVSVLALPSFSRQAFFYG